MVTLTITPLFLTDKSETYEFYHPLNKALTEKKGMVEGHLAHVRKLVEICITKYGECTQMKVKKKTRTEQEERKQQASTDLNSVIVLQFDPICASCFPSSCSVLFFFLLSLDQTVEL